jgi:hypothetical protein
MSDYSWSVTGGNITAGGTSSDNRHPLPGELGAGSVYVNMKILQAAWEIRYRVGDNNI